MMSETKMPARLRLLIPQRARREGPPGRVWSQHPGYRQHGCTLETAAAVAAPFVIAGHCLQWQCLRARTQSGLSPQIRDPGCVFDC